jgi:tetratricopeptide (TPR) repeat protein
MVKPRLTSKLTVTMITALLMATIIIPYGIATAQEGNADRNERRAAHLIEVADKARTRVDRILERLSENGVEVGEEATRLIDEGIELLRTAKESFEARDYESAATQAKEAAIAFRNAARALPERSEPSPEQVEERIRHALNTTRAFATQLNQIVQKAVDLGYNVTEAQSHIQVGLDHLAAAEAALERGNLTEAAEEVAKARLALREAFTSIYHQVGPERLARADRVLTRVTRMTEQVQNHLSKLELPDQVRERINAALENAAASFGTAEESILELEELARELRSVKNAFAGDRADGNIQDAPRNHQGVVKGLTKQIEQLQRRIDHLEEEGVDVSEAQELIDEIKHMLENLRSDVEGDDTESVRAQVTEVRHRLVEVRRLLAGSNRTEG